MFGDRSNIQDKSQITNSKSQTNPNFQYPKSKTNKFRLLGIWLLFIVCNLALGYWNLTYSQNIKQPNVAGAFYPDDPQELSQMIDGFLETAKPEAMEGEIFALISPHAGYPYSGQVAAYGYKLIKARPYKTVVVIGASHQYAFRGISVYPQGFFRTPLGDLEIDKEFAYQLLNKDNQVFFEAKAFAKEHSVEVQLPFLQKTLSNFKIVPIVMGSCSFDTCKKLAILLKEVIASRKDILVVASTDMYHGYDYEEAERVDNFTISLLKDMDAGVLYDNIEQEKAQLCGAFSVVSTIILAKELGHDKISILEHANSAQVTGNKTKGIWTVGYVSCAIDKVPLEDPMEKKESAAQEEKEKPMLSKTQRKRLLEIARSSIQTYLETGKKLEVAENDSLLTQVMGAFVTLHKYGELRGCIGNIVGREPLYLTVRDMAIESAVGDPRFPQVQISELRDIEIEISALSPLERVDSVDKIILGKHGVIIKRGFNSGVFLPQVATETGWSKEEFLSSLCAHKAGLSSDAWKDKATEIYVFTAEVFSEKNY